MRRCVLIAAVFTLGLTSAALAQSSAPPNDDRPPQNSGEPRFDPRNGPPRGPSSEAPFSPRRDFGPPGYDRRDDPRDARRDPPRQEQRHERRPDPRDARRAPPPPPKSQANRRPPPRDQRDARRDDRRYDRRDERDRGPPPRDVARRDDRDRDPPRRDYRDDRPPQRARDHRDAYRDDRRSPPSRDYRDRRDEPRHVARNNPRIHPGSSSEHRRALLREYERNARRQYEIERELGGAPSRPPPYRDRYSDAGPPRR